MSPIAVKGKLTDSDVNGFFYTPLEDARVHFPYLHTSQADGFYGQVDQFQMLDVDSFPNNFDLPHPTVIYYGFCCTPIWGLLKLVFIFAKNSSSSKCSLPPTSYIAIVSCMFVLAFTSGCYYYRACYIDILCCYYFVCVDHIYLYFHNDWWLLASGCR